MRKFVFVMGVALIGCGDDGPQVRPDAVVTQDPDAAVDAPPAVTMMMVGPEGGEVAADNGVTLDIPPGSVDHMTTVTVTVTSTPPAGNYQSASPVVQFGPAGTIFAKPVTVKLPIVGNPTDPAIYWTNKAGTGFERIGGVVENGFVSTEILHFSEGFVAETTAHTRTVTLTSIARMIGATSVRNVPDDLTGALIRAYVPNASGGYDVLTGTGYADGTATIENVPDGPYLLRFANANNYHLRTVSAVDASLTFGGDGHDPVTQATPVAVTATNMTPWADGDFFQIYSLAATTWFSVDATTASNPPAANATTLSAMTFDANDPTVQNFNSPPNLIKAGETTTVLHVAQQQTSTGFTYGAAKEMFSTTAFAQTDGQTSTLSGSFTTAGSTTATANIDYRTTQWTALVPSLAPASTPPTATYGQHFLWIEGGPAAPERCCLGAFTTFLIASVGLAADQATGVMSYILPNETAWTQYGVVQDDYRVCRTAPGASAQACVNVNFHHRAPLASFIGSPVVPVLGPVSNVRVDGVSLDQDRTGVALTPLIQWNAPTLGTPTLYRIQIRAFPSAGGQTLVSNLVVEGSQTQVRVPAGLLQSGQVYSLNIHTFMEPNTPPGTLFDTTYPSTETTSTTAFFTTQ